MNSLIILALFLIAAYLVIWATIEIITYYLFSRDGIASPIMLNSVFSIFYNQYYETGQITYQNRTKSGDWGYICKIKANIFPSLFSYSVETRDQKYYGVLRYTKAHKIIKRKFKELRNGNI